MADAINIAAYSDALVVLGTAGVVVPLLRRFGVNPILGYLAAGAALGPLGIGSFVADFPPLYWITVIDAGNVASIAELGVVFLLFLIGLELSFARLMTMRRVVFGLGTSQVADHDGRARRLAHPARAGAGDGRGVGRLPRAVVDRHRHRAAVAAGPPALGRGTARRFAILLAQDHRRRADPAARRPCCR